MSYFQGFRNVLLICGDQCYQLQVIGYLKDFSLIFHT
mgnify:CR=1 FL=1